MTLSDVHADPQLLAAMLGIPFEAATVIDRDIVAKYAIPQKVTAEERVARAHRDYRAALESDWATSTANPYKRQTWGQFIGECLRCGLGIKGKGKLADRIDYARMSRPDLYQSGRTAAA